MQANVRTYKMKPVPLRVQEKLDKSYEESLGLVERELRCPNCGRLVCVLFSDAGGHIRLLCKNCKTYSTYNLGYFRRQKGFGRHKERMLRGEDYSRQRRSSYR